MFEKAFESTGFFLKTVICAALLVTATAVVVTVAIFVTLTAYRLMQLLWVEIFSFPWTL